MPIDPSFIQLLTDTLLGVFMGWGINQLPPARQVPGKTALILTLIVAVIVLTAALNWSPPEVIAGSDQEIRYRITLTVIEFLKRICPFIIGGIIFYLALMSWRSSKRNPDAATSSNQTSVPTETANDWRRELLKVVETEVNVRLEDSLHDWELISPSMKDQRECVGRPAKETINANPNFLNQLLQPKRLLEVFGVATSQPNQDEKIIDVFERNDIAGRLLILGAPGSGKTTALLELAKDLLCRAKQQPEQPIPAIFELSDWKDDKQSITGWLAATLKFRYNVPEATTREWIEKGQLLPLLDGLDELKDRQAKCVEKINDFLQANSGGLSLVVCCRQENYSEGKAILNKLRGAVCLQPLTDRQIENSLKRLNCGHLWKLIKDDPEGLLTLARMPLLLHLMPVAYPQGLVSQSQRFASQEERRQYQDKCREELFAAYIQRKLKELHDNEGYEPEEVKHWLKWLAQQLKERNQTEFLIEKMQPNLLKNNQKLLYQLIFGLISALVFGLILVFIFDLSRFTLGLSGFILGMILRLSKSTIEPTETLSWSSKRVKIKLIPLLILGLILGLIGGLILWLSSGLILELIRGLILGLILGLISGLIAALIGDEIRTRSKPNQGIIESAKNTIIIGLITCPAFTLPLLAPRLAMGQAIDWSIVILLAVSMALSFGVLIAGLPVIQHYTLRFLLWRSGAIPFNYVKFLSYAHKRKLIKQVGGRYRFFHDLLREHFAQMP
jgi:DNA polymerase III delta prime subunit